MMGVRKNTTTVWKCIYRISYHTVISYHGPHIPPVHFPLCIGIPLQFHDIAQILLKSWWTYSRQACTDRNDKRATPYNMNINNPEKSNKEHLRSDATLAYTRALLYYTYIYYFYIYILCKYISIYIYIYNLCIYRKLLCIYMHIVKWIWWWNGVGREVDLVYSLNNLNISQTS